MPALASPFTAPAQPQEQSWFGRMLRRPDVDGARAALEGTLAKKGPDKVTGAEVNDILEARRVRGAKAAQLKQGLLQRAFKKFVQDDVNRPGFTGGSNP